MSLTPARGFPLLGAPYTRSRFRFFCEIHAVVIDARNHQGTKGGSEELTHRKINGGTKTSTRLWADDDRVCGRGILASMLYLYCTNHTNTSYEYDYLD